MNRLRRILHVLGKIAMIAVVLASVLAIFWAIAYRLILGFTPLWLDMATAGAAAAAMLFLWILGRAKPVDYSAPIKKPSDHTDP